jgi:hypothetical protein
VELSSNSITLEHIDTAITRWESDLFYFLLRWKIHWRICEMTKFSDLKNLKISKDRNKNSPHL